MSGEAIAIASMVLVAYAVGYGMALWQIVSADRRFPYPGGFLPRLPWPVRKK